MSEITAPVVNLNGTDWNDLLEQHMAVVSGLTAAINAMQRAEPHGRDYPIEGTYTLARAQFAARHGALSTLLRDYTRLSVAIANQERKR
jgi:hypothetical protein